MHLTLQNPAACSCPACRAASTPSGAANIANWNTYATARTAVACDPVECAICGAYEQEAAMEVYATRRICPDCRLDLIAESDRMMSEQLAAMMIADSRYAYADN